MKSRWLVLCFALGFSSSTASRAAETIYCPATGNYYEYVEHRGVVWIDAAAAAANSTFQGVAGHLLTVTSSQESDCITKSSLLPRPDPTRGDSVWVGGFQICDPPSCSEPDGGWMWITGEYMYWVNWCPGEPNDSDGGEDHMELLVDEGYGERGCWNDAQGDAPAELGYVIEYPPSLFFSDGFESGDTSAWGTPPIAEFTYETMNLLVTFYNNTTGTEPIMHLWDFGDGSTSTVRNPVHPYSQAGTFTVILTAQNLYGTDIVAHAVTVPGP